MLFKIGKFRNQYFSSAQNSRPVSGEQACDLLPRYQKMFQKYPGFLNLLGIVEVLSSVYFLYCP